MRFVPIRPFTWAAAVAFCLTVAIPSQGATLEHVVSGIHHINELAIQAGLLAQEKGQSTRVKNFASMLVREHTAADQKLSAIAAKQNIKVVEFEPATPEEEQDLKLELEVAVKLFNAQGADFDKQFWPAVILAHQKALEQAAKIQSTVRGTPFEAYLAEVVPQLQSHLAQAEQLSRQP